MTEMIMMIRRMVMVVVVAMMPKRKNQDHFLKVMPRRGGRQILLCRFCP